MSQTQQVDSNNAWRTESPGVEAWSRTARPGDANKFFIVSSDGFRWASDCPHHEGTWPHSSQAIERQMGHFEDDERARILGLNAAKLFKFDVPERAQ
jgi:hypothetical protein